VLLLYEVGISYERLAINVEKRGKPELALAAGEGLLNFELPLTARAPQQSVRP
jgi:hypothetical protein